MRGPFDLSVDAGSLAVQGVIARGDSRIRCDIGSVKVRLEPGSDVRIKVDANMSKPDVRIGEWAGRNENGEWIVGDGTASLAIARQHVLGQGPRGVMTHDHRHRPPRDCPVCGTRLALTRLGCPECGSELAGEFEPCEFCGLSAGDRELLLVFLQSRGNMKELERHLGVSYPTARARFDELLARLGLQRRRQGRTSRPQADRLRSPPSKAELLRSLARGDIDVDEAARRLRPS